MMTSLDEIFDRSTRRVKSFLKQAEKDINARYAERAYDYQCARESVGQKPSLNELDRDPGNVGAGFAALEEVIQ